jgi:pimeloyl-ACP methyl ester carboxylesterase
MQQVKVFPRAVDMAQLNAGKVFSFSSSDGLDYLGYIPRTDNKINSTLAVVHGLNRNPVEMIFRFRDLADRLGVALFAPFFHKTRFRHFQQLKADETGLCPKAAFDNAYKNFLAHTALTNEKLYMLGFSGGGQFAHRYVLTGGAYKVDKLMLIASGWYTMPSADEIFPLGLKRDLNRDHLTPDIARLQACHTSVVIGSNDVKRSTSLNTDKQIDTMQGRNRLSRARNWVAAMEALAEKANAQKPRLVELKGAGHNFTSMMSKYGLREYLTEWIQG